ncbi:MarR family winged helix-turn-helix transcriptional regulator [Microbacterium sp. NPDC007973]|uniref:MarR family winged helix-turn-helix transcriptional regulator n=1 Tax=Microbacterium sp. NPDC007973 TaxID=3364182 RepID=UPI0036E997D1
MYNHDPVIDAVAVGTRAMLGLTLRSLGPTLEVVTVQQWRVLALLDRLGELRLVDIGAQLESAPPTTSRLVERLVAKGLIDRRVSERSRRENLMRLTPNGRQLVGEAKQRRRDAIAELMTSFSDEERAAIGRAAELLTSRLEDELPQSQIL